jgi:hypothetical protein
MHQQSQPPLRGVVNKPPTHLSVGEVGGLAGPHSAGKIEAVSLETEVTDQSLMLGMPLVAEMNN